MATGSEILAFWQDWDRVLPEGTCHEDGLGTFDPEDGHPQVNPAKEYDPDLFFGYIIPPDEGDSFKYRGRNFLWEEVTFKEIFAAWRLGGRVFTVVIEDDEVPHFVDTCKMNDWRVL